MNIDDRTSVAHHIKYSFPGQREDEEIVVVIRRHWMAFLRQMGGAGALFLAGLIIGVGAIVALPSLAEPPVLAVTVLVALIFIIIIWIIATIAWLDFYLDTWIVTRDRVIDISQKGLFHRTVAEFPLEKVQDVTSESHGFLPTFLKYGDAHVQTAGAEPRFTLETVACPDEIKQLILELSRQAMQRREEGRRQP